MGARRVVSGFVAVLAAGCRLQTPAVPVGGSEVERECVRACQDENDRCTRLRWGAQGTTGEWQIFLAELGLRVLFRQPCAERLADCYSTCAPARAPTAPASPPADGGGASAVPGDPVPE